MNWRSGGADDPRLLTPEEFVSIARNRGRDVRLETTHRGEPFLTDGQRRYALPKLPGGLMPSALVEALCDLFDVPETDAALDWPSDD